MINTDLDEKECYVPIIVFALLGLVIIVSTIGAYLWLGGFASTLSNHGADWANFGNYVGGVAGPLLSFLALIAVVWTVRLQYELLQRDRERQLADQHIRWLDAIYRDIQDVLQSSLATTTGDAATTTLRATLENEANVASVRPEALKTHVVELMALLAQYCEAVALYRDNITEFFDLKIFVDRGARILDRIKPFHALLGTMSPITIELCDMNLRGDRSRKKPEALTRRTRRQ